MNEDNPATSASEAVEDNHDGNVIEQEISDEIADTNTIWSRPIIEVEVPHREGGFEIQS